MIVNNSKHRIRVITILLLVVISTILYGYFRPERPMTYPSIKIETEADFLTKDYFTELSNHYEQIRSDYRKWYLFDDSTAIASHAILNHMMEGLLENQDQLYNNKYFELFFETFDEYVKQLPYITEEIHYIRNVLNQYGDAPEQLEEMIELAACGKWQFFSARYHRYEVSEYDAAHNIKFISSDGRFEVVYNSETGQIVNDPVNMGTYNYAPGSFIPWKYYQHHQYDKVPWKKWGNTNEVSYKEIAQRESRQGSKKQKESSEAVKDMIATKESESLNCN